MILIFLFVTIAATSAVFLFLRLPKFGATPKGTSLDHISRSPYFTNGKFQNLNPTPNLKEGTSIFAVLKEFIFNKSKRLKPDQDIKSQKTDIHGLDSDQDVLVWFGHSSYYIQVDKKRFLVDPVFSGHASPIKSTTRSFPGADRYKANDIPEIDYLFITHDHWDHLDFETLSLLKPKIKKIITGLGVGPHLIRWGFDPEKILETNWNNSYILEPGFVVHATPARHFSGRGLKRDRSLWMSFALKTPTQNIFIGGDSGFDSHYSEIGKAHGLFDLAILECGQYNEYWKYIHMMPEQTVEAATALQARLLLPVHWAKFALALHAWDEPIVRVTAAAKKIQQEIVHPQIGQLLNLKNPGPTSAWWEELS